MGAGPAKSTQEAPAHRREPWGRALGQMRKAEEAFRRAAGQGSDEARHNLEQLRLVIDQL